MAGLAQPQGAFNGMSGPIYLNVEHSENDNIIEDIHDYKVIKN